MPDVQTPSLARLEARASALRTTLPDPDTRPHTLEYVLEQAPPAPAQVHLHLYWPPGPQRTHPHRVRLHVAEDADPARAVERAETRVGGWSDAHWHALIEHLRHRRRSLPAWRRTSLPPLAFALWRVSDNATDETRTHLAPDGAPAARARARALHDAGAPRDTVVRLVVDPSEYAHVDATGATPIPGVAGSPYLPGEAFNLDGEHVHDAGTARR